MFKQYLEVGQIVGTHGVRGEVRVNPWCDSPDFLKKFKILYYDSNGEKSVKIKSSRVHGNVVLMQLEDISTVEQASALKNKILFMNRKDAKIPDNTYFIQDLMDCKVIDADSGVDYGILTDVSETGANDVWHITKDNKEYLIPAIPSVVIDTDVMTGIIKIRPLRGIFDDEN